MIEYEIISEALHRSFDGSGYKREAASRECDIHTYIYKQFILFVFIFINKFKTIYLISIKLKSKAFLCLFQT